MVQYSIKNDTLMCYFLDSMDSESSLKHKDEIVERANENDLPVVFDMKDAEAVSMEFLAICLKVLEDKGRDQFTMINVNQDVRYALKMAKLDTKINFSLKKEDE